MKEIQRPLIRSLPINSQGRDFVVGDLHGCFDLLERLLEHVRFDTGSDRLFSVGDLIDRGPYSWRCLRLLKEAWCHVVLGNHELMLLDFFSSYFDSRRLENLHDHGRYGFYMNGGAWIENHYEADNKCMASDFDRYLHLVRELPFICVVGHGDTRFQVLHAELVRPDYRLSGPLVWLDEDIDRWRAGEKIHENTLERLFWGRTLMLSSVSRNISPLQEGLSTTYCGHTIVNDAKKLLSHVCLDTGAYRSQEVKRSESGKYGLTLYSVYEKRLLKVSYGYKKLIETLDVT